MNIKQVQASNPRNSVWVSASAGTGKTKVLTDRLLRLLLNDVSIDKILCLTFTNAAAKEMQERIKSKLFSWANMPASQLKNELSNIAASAITDEQMHKAKKLYKRLLRHEDKLNIYTIHAFCQKILKQFSLEAGTNSDTSIMDDITYQQIITDIKQQIWQEEALKPITDFMLSNFHESTISQIFEEIIACRLKFDKNKGQNSQKASFDFANIIAKITYTKENAYKILSCQPEIEHYLGVSLSKAQLKGHFLTAKGEKKKKLLRKNIAPEGSDLSEKMLAFQEQIYLLDQQERQMQTKGFAELIEAIAGEIIQRYNNYKSQHSLLDYDDLIELTCELLSSSNDRAWVLYKLDGGVDHILVDEAQDTSPKQWQIVQALIEEFFAGNNAEEEKRRTLFVVGDEKQSIFSFQGADLATFQKMNSFASKKITNSGAKLNNIDLSISYRSSPAILQFVEQVFAKLKQRANHLFSVKMKEIKPHRGQNYGRVSLWPVTSKLEQENIFWQYTPQSQRDSASLLANKISTYIKQQLQSMRVLPATGERITAGDFMILFRSRDDLTYKVMKRLEQENIENSGLDRLTLKDELIICDIIALARFVLNPFDDLNLASLLKAPYFHLSEEHLQELCTCRPKDSSLWAHMQATEAEALGQLNFFLRCYSRYPLSQFFNEILYRFDYLELLLSWHGHDAKEVVAQFLYLVNKYSTSHGSSLAKFTSWFLQNETEIKRENSPKGKVQIMTVHGSKGLQAPIVILCDTTTLPTSKDRLLWHKDTLNCYFKSSFVPERFKKITEEKKQAALEEYMRLFYVALTRAEDELVICGHSNRKTLPDNCWYSLAANAMSSINSAEDDEGSLILTKQENYNFAGLLSKCDEKQNTPLPEVEPLAKSDDGFLPDFTTACQYELQQIEELSKRHKRTNYGIIFHKIIEEATRHKDSKILLNHPLIDSWPQHDRQRYHQEASNILSNKQFCQLIEHQECYPELEFIYNNKVGRIDLLVKRSDSNEIYIIDYKTDANHKDGSKVPAGYILQVQTYAKAVSFIFKDYKISCYLLWTASGSMQEVDICQASEVV